jgi:fatty-acyl-CoA synthase
MAQLSYSRGPHLALREETVFEALSQMAARLPANEAVVVRHQNVRLSYRELKDRVDQTARGLVGLGLEPGDRLSKRAG